MENTISTLQPRKWSDMILSLIGTSLRTSCNEPEENSVVPKIIILWFTVPYHGSGYAYGKKNWSDLFLLPFLYTEKLGCQKLLAIWVTTCRTGIWFQIVSKISNILFVSVKISVLVYRKIWFFWLKLLYCTVILITFFGTKNQ